MENVTKQIDTTQPKRVNLGMAVLFTSGMLITANTVMANEDIVVDESTPDSVIIEGKNLDKMYAVAQPSVRLNIKIEGINKEIKVEPQDQEIVLHVEDATYQEVQDVKAIYTKITGTDKVATQVTFTEEFDGTDVIETDGTLSEMGQDLSSE